MPERIIPSVPISPKPRLYVDPDIRKAETLPASFYRDPQVFEELKEKVFARSWQWVGDESLVPEPESVCPLRLLDDYLAEPMMIVRDKDNVIKCLSNVCTHRGNIVAQRAGKCRQLICNYHGRRFGLDGAFISMPEFKETLDFPRAADNLHEFPLKQWGPFLFTGINPAFDLDQVIRIMEQRVGFLPLSQFRLAPHLSKEYPVNCHWALYCDNYLEGFHIPFVHADLNTVLDYGQYATELYDHLNLQIGYSDTDQDVFDLPEGHPDSGKHVAAYYFWLFPNMMFNFYPWGLSVNIVKPVSMDKTTVTFITYVYDESKLRSGAGAQLDKVEKEDEAVVENVQRGLQSRVYRTGRFSPTREQGTHQFHRLLAERVSAPIRP